MEQQSEEWFAVRVLHMTASDAQAIASGGDGFDTLCHKLVMEKYCINNEHFSNKYTEHGNKYEPTARTRYFMETNKIVKEVGFVELSDYVGCSPDGLVGDNGLIEIKCPTNKVFFEYSLYGKVATNYMWQMQMQMYVCDRQWCDYVVYSPNFENDIVIKRIEKDDKMIEQLKTGLIAGEKRIKELDKLYAKQIQNRNIS